KAFVLDDSIKIRHGKKMPGVSSHFDHTLGCSVMGQQVLNLGYSCEHGFVPLDSEIFISDVKFRVCMKNLRMVVALLASDIFRHCSSPNRKWQKG
ncbi:hypothetical protein BMR09_16825, partial [Methylococcaceae bacterium CS3]